MGSSLKVLYDGWSLIRHPLDPAGSHLQALLASLPDQVEPILGFPGIPPDWIGQVESEIYPAADTPLERLRWEQQTLPALAKNVKADLLHMTSPTGPLSGRIPCVISWTGYFENLSEAHIKHRPGDRTVFSRLRDSLGRGGLARARAILFPEDVSLTRSDRSFAFLPPIVHPDFNSENISSPPAGRNGNRPGPLEVTGLPETYILYHGPVDDSQLRRIAEAWGWAAGPVGQYYPLQLIGLPEVKHSLLEQLSRQYDLEKSIFALPPLSPDALSWLYRNCSAVFHPAPASLWSGSIRHALACGKPLVAAENPVTSGMVGPAAYLVSGDDPRALGAALITVIVEDQVANQLSEAASVWTSGWDRIAFTEQLGAIYEEILG